MARVPKVTVNVGGAVGDDLYTMCGPGFDPAFYFAWPRAGLRHNLADPAIDPKLKAEVTEEADDLDLYSAQFWTSRCVADGVILPVDTREVVLESLRLATLNYVGNRELNRVAPGLLRGAGVTRM